jgi:hypothetical protein
MINWGSLQQGGGFQNALATGLQLGAMARQRQDEREFRNALTQFDPNNPETLKPIMAARPEVGMQLQGQMAERASKQADARRADLPTLTRLLEGSTDQASYERNVGVAQQYGVDVSTLPQQFDPAWRDQQLASLRILQTPEAQVALSNIGKEVTDMGFRPGTPEFNAKVNEIWTASQNRVFSYQPGGGAGLVNAASGQVQQFVVPGTVQPQVPAPMQQAPREVPVVPTDIFQADVASLGLPGAIRFAVSKGLAVPISGDAEYALLPSGAAFVGPDGQMRRKP